MDKRIPLAMNTQLVFGETTYVITRLIGYGAKAMVYLAKYRDNLHGDKYHTVLIKELFPYHPKGLITRKDGKIECESEAQEYFELQRKSFVHGNIVNLDYQNIRADLASININSFERNGTIYTILGNSNGETLKEAASRGYAFTSLYDITACMLNILDALEIFHKNGLLHLDISPDNILLMPLKENQSEKYRKLILIDYNSAWSTAELEENNDIFLSMKESYSPPELRLNERSSICPASDLFSVCAIFLEFLQGEPLDFSILYSHSKIIDTKTEIMKNAPATVVNKIITILRRGLCLSPNLRYQSAAEMRADFEELLNRIDGIGVTHSALWEASRTSYHDLVHKKEQYKYLLDENNLLPCKMSLNDEKVQTFNEAIKALFSHNSWHGQIVANGGMGKTTAFLLLWMAGISSYNPNMPVPVYITLYNYKQGSMPYIKGCLLERLKFDKETATVEDALRALDKLLDTVIRNKKGNLPSVLLLLDGLNEVNGDDRMLLLEIDEMMKKAGVQVLFTSRIENTHLKLNKLEILPLTDIEIKDYLMGHKVLYPMDKALQEILSNPMLLSIYVKACKQEHKNIDIHSTDELLAKYLNSLLLSYNDQTIGNEKEQIQAEYTINCLLPAIVGNMKKTKKYVLYTNEVYAVVQKCFYTLGNKSFLRVFPQYVGKIKHIKGDAQNAEEWFDRTIYQLLINKFALLIRDEYSSYRLIHQNYHDFLNGLNEKNQRKISQFKLNREVVFDTIADAARMVFHERKRDVIDTPSDKPRQTEEEKALLNNAVTALADNFAKLGMLIKSDIDMLKVISEKQFSFSGILKQRVQDNPIFTEDQFLSSRIIAALHSSKIPIPLLTLKELFSSLSGYSLLSAKMCESLNMVFADESEYSEKDKSEIVELYKEYINSLSNSYFLKLQLIMQPLTDEGRKPLLNALPYIEVFRDKLLTMSLDRSKSEVESLIKAEAGNSKRIVGLIKSFGI